MPNDKKLPAPIPTTLPQAQSSGLVARGLLAVRQSLAVADKNDAEALFKKGIRYFTTRRYNYLAPSDYDKARPYLLAAAKLNHAEAQFELYGLLQIEDELLHRIHRRRGERERARRTPRGPAACNSGKIAKRRALYRGAGTAFNPALLSSFRAVPSPSVSRCSHDLSRASSDISAVLS